MVSPVKQLSSSQEGMECFLATLSRASLSPRGRLIGVIESADPVELANELAENAANYSALELAICLYAVRQHPHLQSVASVLAGGLLKLASRLSSNDTCCYSTWNQLLSLLSKKPPIHKLAVFLQGDDEPDADILDDNFVYTLCTKLADILSVENLDLHRVLLDYSVVEWIDKRFPESPDCVSALLLAFYMCSQTRADSWDLQGISTSVAAKEFVLEAISKAECPEKTEALLAAFTNVLEDDSWHFVRDLTPKALEMLTIIIKKCTHGQDPSLCLAILDNTVSTWEQKLTFATDIITTLPQLNSSFLFVLCSRLLQATHTQEPKALNDLKQFFELVSNKPWSYDAINVNVEYNDFFTAYIGPVDRCINGDIPTIIHALYGHDPKYCTTVCDKIKRKMLSAVVAKFVQFADENRACLSQLHSSRRDYRTALGLKIKTASVALVFFLYDAIETRAKKKKAFTFLKKEIRPIQTTLEVFENKVKKVYMDGIPALSYAEGDYVYRIKNPSKMLHSQTPRADGLPVD